ncbi:type II toxin-antitoxin system CcdA family antitoxin [Amaricoccus solimangrovi]|uniref:type II toxin-antitoxin system CcdA family antitoxin n=1 Tax=Amaricoccus solimangrovi TaxID=2589815 RepID=UPI001F325B20|nr:type II toxin-antitoxin system CcdA family antitoxin [Amaricoccus solimangrovi]
MAAPLKTKTSVSLDASALDAPREFGVNVSAVAEVALKQAVAEARRRKWLEDNAAAFAGHARRPSAGGYPRRPWPDVMERLRP